IRDGSVTGVQPCALPIYAAVDAGHGAAARALCILPVDHAPAARARIGAARAAAHADATRCIQVLARVAPARRADADAAPERVVRSEERRVGKEGRSRREG